MKRYKSLFESLTPETRFSGVDYPDEMETDELPEQKVPEHPVVKNVKIPGGDTKFQSPGYFHNAGSDKLKRKSAK